MGNGNATTYDNVFWARVEFRAYRQHYKRMTDAEIVADVRASMECMDDLDGEGSSFGAGCVRAAFERHNRRAEVNKQNAKARWGKGDANGIEYGSDGHGGLGECARSNGDAFDGCNDAQNQDAGNGCGALDEVIGDRKTEQRCNNESERRKSEVYQNAGCVVSDSIGANRVSGGSTQEITSGGLVVQPVVFTGCADVDSGNSGSVGAVVVKKATRTTIPKIPQELIERDPDVVEAWRGFVEMRKAKKAPLTEHAAKLIFSKLINASAKPSQVLNLSTERNYTGVFPDKPCTDITSTVARKMNADALTAWGLFPEVSRGRSSTVQFITEWMKLGANRPSMDALKAGLDSWVKSEKWASDGGKWIEGAHKWLSRMQWLNPQRSQMEIALDTARETAEHFR